MAIEIDGKVYRNLQEQVAKNMEDIEELKEHGTGQTYTAGDGINISEENVISIDSTVETKANATSRFVSKTNLTDFSINDIIVADSEIQSGAVDLRAVSSQEVKSEVSLDPTSTIIRTMSGTDTSTIGISGTEIDVTTSMFKYNSNEVATKDDILEYESGDGILITTSGDHLRQISVSSDVAMKTDLVDYYGGTNVSLTPHSGASDIAYDINVPLKTVNGNSLAGTGNIVISGASVYEYELVFDESDYEDTWSYRFISTDGTLVNTSVPETYAELVQFVQDYGLNAVNLYKLVGYAVDNGNTYYSTLYYNSINNSIKVTFPGRADQTIDGNNLILNSIKLYKRTC